MANSRKDDNGFIAWCGISCVDGVTPVRITVNASNKGMEVDHTTVISIVPSSNFPHKDDNGYPVLMGVSSTNPNTVLPVYVNPTTGAVLVTT